MSSDSMAGRRFSRRLLRAVGWAIADYGMIGAGDRALVYLSGGEDSSTVLDLLLQLRPRAPVDFTLTAVNPDQKQPEFPAAVGPHYFSARGAIVSWSRIPTAGRALKSRRVKRCMGCVPACVAGCCTGLQFRR